MNEENQKSIMTVRSLPGPLAWGVCTLLLVIGGLLWVIGGWVIAGCLLTAGALAGYIRYIRLCRAAGPAGGSDNISSRACGGDPAPARRQERER